MNSFTLITDLAHVIELAVAPVFLLAGIAGFLTMMSVRLGRIVDRSRCLKELVETTKEASSLEMIHAESELLWQRMGVINLAIGLCTGSALLVCLLIVSLFLGAFWSLSISVFIIALFVLSMLLLIAALILFLKEVRLTTQTMNITR